MDVVAPADGRLGRLYAAAGEAVEYGQELVRIDGVEASVTGLGPGASEAGPGGSAATGADTDDRVTDAARDVPRSIDLDSRDETDAGIETASALLVE